MGKSCKDVAQSLVDCMKNSSCVKEGGELNLCIKKMSLKEGGTVVASECQELRTAYTLCKRGGLDMRTRIRGQRVY